MGQIVNLSEIEQSLATLTAGSIFARVADSIETLKNTEIKDSEWLTEVVELVEFSQKIEAGFGLTKAYALAVVKDYWEELPLATRAQYGYIFLNFARNITGKQRSTIDNYINTARVWLIDKRIPPFGKVAIKLRNTEGKPIVDQSGRYIYQDVEFNPFLIDMTKLLVTNARAKANEMTKELWEKLVDDYYTVEDLQLALVTETTSSGNGFDVYYSIEGPGLFASRNDETACIAEELNWEEYETNDLVHAAIDKICTCLGVELDEDIIYKRQRHAD